MKYKTVVIDPPWTLDCTKSPKTLMNRDRKPSLQRESIKTSLPYDTLDTQDIIDFPINDFADEESLLFLWVVNKHLRLGFEILDAWGFTYHTTLTWVKGQGFALWSPIMTHTEHILFAWRGNFRKLCHDMGVMKNYLVTNYQLKHSQKPARFYQLLRAWTPKPRIDIFARNAHEGFDGWGDEYVGEGPLAPYLKEKMKC